MICAVCGRVIPKEIKDFYYVIIETFKGDKRDNMCSQACLDEHYISKSFTTDSFERLDRVGRRMRRLGLIQK